MNKFYKFAAFFLSVMLSTAAVGCTGLDPIYKYDKNAAIDYVADFSRIVDPPLLKKVSMYNAGIIQPLTNYDRDLERIREMNAESLRIDLSIGKDVGTAGQYLVDGGYADDAEFPDSGYNVDLDLLTYDFTQLDDIVNKINANDVLPYMSWSYIPYPLQYDGKWNDLDQNILNWKEAWEEIYYRYAKHYVDEGVKIGYHEIYNEPDLEKLIDWDVFDKDFDGFLKLEDFNAGRYIDMYEYGVKGILRADPDATIGGPAFAMGELVFDRAVDWIGLKTRVIEKDLPMDFYSWHTYLDGNTWFRPGAENDTEERVINEGLGSHPKFIKTASHANEFSYLNNENGASAGKNSHYNFYTGAWRTLNGVMEAVERTSLQWVHWAQFMESTGGYDPYGLIDQNGNVKAPFNAMKIYNDIPVLRYEVTPAAEQEGIKTLVAATDDKIGYLFWNESDKDRVVNAVVKNAAFSKGTRRVYRIDENRASYYDEADPELKAEEVKKKVSTDGSVWMGKVPANGVVYITVNKDGKEDFTAWDDRQAFADDVKTSYYYEDRYRGMEGSYAHFDRGTWTMYLGQGSAEGNKAGQYVGQAHANASVIAKKLPNEFRLKIKTEGEPKALNKNSALGFRIDFFDATKNDYVKSVYFHNGIYSENRDPNAQDPRLKNLPEYAWGTETKPDQVVSFDGDVCDIKLSDYAPSGWSAETGKAQVSFQMQNTGANSRAVMQLIKKA